MDKTFTNLVAAFVVCGFIGMFWGMAQPEPSAFGGFVAGIIVAGVGATAVAGIIVAGDILRT